MRYLPDPAKSLKTILKRKVRRKGGRKLKEKEEEKLATMVIRVPKYKKDMIKILQKDKEDMRQILLEVE